MPTRSLVSDLILRPPTFEDAEAVYALEQICAVGKYGAPDISLADLEAHWRLPETDLARDSWLVTSPSGEIVGYGRVVFFARARFYSYLLVHPAFRDWGVGEHLIALIEAHARELLTETPVAGRVVLLHSINEPNAWAAKLLEEHGFHAVRGHLRMEIVLSEPPEEPKIPASLTLRTLIPGQDDRTAWAAHSDGFSDHWNFVPAPFEIWAHWTVAADNFDPTLFFLMMDGDEIAGMAHCEIRGELGWVNDLSVRKPWRRRGIALSLLRHAFAEFYERGFRTVGLGVDAESTTGAPQLYSRAGMRPTRRELSYEKSLQDIPVE